MSDFFLQNQIYIVLCTTLILWIGIVLYLLRIEKKIAQIEKQLKKD
jgi:CcmD family protein